MENNVDISFMTNNDLEIIKPNLITDFDDYWNYNILKEELNSPNSKYIVAKIDGNIVGFAGAKFILDTAEIMNIVVKKSCRNSGIGTLLLKELISICVNNNIKSIFLDVNSENVYAQKLYKNCGFEEISVRKNYYKNNDAIVMNLTY